MESLYCQPPHQPPVQSPTSPTINAADTLTKQLAELKAQTNTLQNENNDEQTGKRVTQKKTKFSNFINLVLYSSCNCFFLLLTHWEILPIVYNINAIIFHAILVMSWVGSACGQEENQQMPCMLELNKLFLRAPIAATYRN